jgi:hypothetical protein
VRAVTNAATGVQATVRIADDCGRRGPGDGHAGVLQVDTDGRGMASGQLMVNSPVHRLTGLATL